MWRRIFSLNSRILMARNEREAVNAVCEKSRLFSTDVGRFKVEHDEGKSCFFLTNTDGGATVGRLDYSLSGGVMDLYHTEVNPEQQGKGLAKLLAKASLAPQSALEHGATSRTRMVLTCTYLQKYFRENPDKKYEDLVESS